MDSAVRARLIDAALPYVAGRRLRTHGLTEAEAAALTAHADAGSGHGTLVAMGEAPGAAGDDLLLMLFLGAKSPPPLAGLGIIEVQYAFRIPYGLADDTAEPTLGPDANWPYSRLGAGVWLDTAEPHEPLGCLVIAQEKP